LITCLTDNQEPSPCLIWLPAPDITATLPECFSQLILAIRQCIHISLVTERWYLSLEPCRLIYYSGSWYLIALQKGKLRVFPLADIKSVSLTSERFERRDHIHSLVAEERFISALPHFPFIHKLINTFNL
ncbi:WYL domain-containing protein, partial [Escherichia coli]